MGSMLALIVSIMLGGMILVSFQQFNRDFSEDIYRDTLDKVASDNLDNLQQIIEYDFSRIGIGVNDPAQAVLTNADSTDFTYWADSDGNGTLETIRYYLGATTAAVAAATANPNDMVLYRVVNGGTPAPVSTGLTDFKIQFFDSGGNETADLSAIRTLIVSLSLESDYAAFAEDNAYPKLLWQERFTPPSLVVRP